jgi:glycosyltransferase involved in cell wall biosynthesis
VRILLCSWHRAVAGGAEQYLRGLIPALAARGHEVAFLHEHQHTEGDGTVDPPGSGIPLWCADELGADAALEAAAGWRPDVAYNQGMGSSDLEAALIAHVPTVLFAHGYYGTCATGTKRHAYPSVTACTRTFGPACLALHYPRRCGGLDPRALLAGYRQQAARFALLPRYRAVLVASSHMQHEFARHGVLLGCLRVAPLPPGDLTPDAMPPAERPLTGRILFLGRLTAEKGAGLLVDAIPGAERGLGRRLTLTVAGTGPERDALQRRALERGVDAAFPGWLAGDARLRALREADLVAVPSVWGEPFGLVGIEAGCVGTPAVGFAMGGIPDWLKAGETGELAPADPPDVAGLADAMTRALGDPAHHQRLRVGAWTHARRYGMDAHLDALEPILATATR